MIANTSRNTSLAPERRHAIACFYGALQTGEFAALDDVLTPEWEDVPLAPGQAIGPAGIKPIFAQLRAAFPDIRVEMVDLLAERDRAACRLSISGTHGGPLFGVAASGRPVSFVLHEFHEFDGDRIRRTFHLEDLFGLFGQIGQWPTGAATT